MNEYDDEKKHERAPEPPIIVEINGKHHTVADILSYRFMSQEISINGEFSEIIDVGPPRMVTANARIKLMTTTNGSYIIEMRDDIFFPNKKNVYVEIPGYIYDSYQRAVSMYRRLGYDDLYGDGTTKYEREIQAIIAERKNYIQEWWNGYKNRMVQK